MFYSHEELEGIAIFTLLAGALLGISHLITVSFANLDSYVFYQVDFIFNAIKYISIIGFSFYVSLEWRKMNWKKVLKLLVLILMVTTLCNMQMKVVTEEGIVFRSLFSTESKDYTQVNLVRVKYENTPTTSRVSYTIIFDDDHKMKFFDPFNINKGKKVLYLKSKVQEHNPIYKIDDLDERRFKLLMDYEQELMRE
ncbi:hypothetical protein EZV73_01595 [Acidaminobacter sp. JC074]|uniref:hypothetical protein n=1 Tax=Acidaminobacter sp. JC074 TaxID=2530199 RepID=UPI001F0E1A43|nr:hypothetical protein [Acidaminobacter sp. JC074]MCH4886238.1 hypothetical protein [Acidaminobacter sp. JC074]